MEEEKRNNRRQTTLDRRISWLYTKLLTTPRISFNVLNDAWRMNCSLNPEGSDWNRRTFYRTCRDVEARYNVKVKHTKKKGGGYYISQPERDEADSGIGSARSMLDQALVIYDFLSNHEMEQFVEMDSSQDNLDHLITIINAIKARTMLLLNYRHNYDATRDEDILVIPIGLKLFRQRWYLVSENYYGEHLTYSYPLDRILSIKPEGPGHTNRNLHKLFRDSFGIIRETDKLPVDVDIKVEKEQARYVKSVPLHHSQQVVEDAEDFTIFRLHVSPTYDFIMELMSHGDRVEVIAPLNLRTEMYTRALDLVKVYEKKN